MRSSIFTANVAKINTHNVQGKSWSMAINKFTDLSAQEFLSARSGGYRSRVRSTTKPPNDNFAQCVTIVVTLVLSSVPSLPSPPSLLLAELS